MLQGQKDLLTVGRLILSELAPVVGAQQARVLRARRQPRRAAADAARQLRLRAASSASASQLELGEGLVGQCALEKQKILLDQRAARLHPHRLRPGRGAAAQHPRAAGRVRRPGQGRARARVVRALQPDAPGVPRSAHREHRHRAQHDRSQHAHRGPAQAVAVAGQELQSRQEELQQTNQELQEKAQLLAAPERRRSSARTTKSSRPARRWRRRPSSWRSPRSTSPSSWPTCRTSCARRSTAC